MNLILQKDNFYIKKINLLKKKKNTVVDGIFTKFTYSNEYFIMNGIYLEFPIHNMNMKTENKLTIMTYQPYEKENIEYLRYIHNLELQLLEYYNNTNNIHKRPVIILTTKLYSGNIKSNIKDLTNISNTIIIKISGIWETDNEIGLAIKIMYTLDDI